MDDDLNYAEDNRKKRDTFLKTFQKPTQIYRYLKHRHDACPTFLHRNLAYLPGRKSRINQPRKSFDMNNLLNNLSIINSKLSQSQSKQSLQTVAAAANEANGKSIYFNFLSSKSIRQLTKTKSFCCPWCFVNCYDLEPLIMHLKLCHSRFTFTHQTVSKGYRIDIRLNDNYDGSYSGYKYPGHDLLTDFKFSQRNRRPTRRTPFTQIIFLRSSKASSMSSLSNILPTTSGASAGTATVATLTGTDWIKVDEDSSFVLDDGPFNERLYYHTTTCLPIKPDETDLDSEADNDPLWLRERTQLMIDEFVDVNDGEKQMLKLWNLHMMQNRRYVGDYQIPDACREFIHERGHEIISKCLVGNLILHLVNLHEFNLITSSVIVECVRALHKQKRRTNTTSAKDQYQHHHLTRNKSVEKIKIERLDINEITGGSPPKKKYASLPM